MNWKRLFIYLAVAAVLLVAALMAINVYYLKSARKNLEQGVFNKGAVMHQ